MDHIWKSWEDFNQTINGRRVVFFGVADDWFEKTFERSTPNLAYIVDNSPTRKGKKYFVNEHYGEIDVKDPSVLKEKDADIYVVITSGAFFSIVPELESYGLKAGVDFCCTPGLNNLRVISEFDQCATKLLVCSSDHKIYSHLGEDTKSGGGLYLYDLKTKTYEKVLTGSIHHVIDAGDHYFILEEQRGCLVVNKNNYEVTAEFGVEPDMFCHGLAYDPKRQFVFIGKSGLDKISIYDAKTYEHKTDIALSEKTEKFKRDMHHMNDLAVHGDYLYVSIFSHSGSRPIGVYNGGVLEIDIDDPSRRHILISDAWMPHSIRFINDELHYLDSMNSILWLGNKIKLGTFSGFIRGLDFDGRFFFIGQSESRYFDRLKGIKDYISMSGGFYMFDNQSKAGKFFSLPVRQVRNLTVVKQ